MIPDRRAANGDDQIGALGQPKRFSSEASVSRAIGRIRASAPMAFRSIAGEAKAVGGDDLVGPGIFAGHDQFIAGRDQGDDLGTRVTVHRGMFIAASRAMSPGRRRRGAASTSVSPCREISAGGADVIGFGPGSVRRDHVAARSTSSWMTTLSAPPGTGAPVKMRTACPGPDVPVQR